MNNCSQVASSSSLTEYLVGRRTSSSRSAALSPADANPITTSDHLQSLELVQQQLFRHHQRQQKREQLTALALQLQQPRPPMSSSILGGGGTSTSAKALLAAAAAAQQQQEQDQALLTSMVLRQQQQIENNNGAAAAAVLAAEASVAKQRNLLAAVAASSGIDPLAAARRLEQQLELMGATLLRDSPAALAAAAPSSSSSPLFAATKTGDSRVNILATVATARQLLQQHNADGRSNKAQQIVGNSLAGKSAMIQEESESSASASSGAKASTTTTQRAARVTKDQPRESTTGAEDSSVVVAAAAAASTSVAPIDDHEDDCNSNSSRRSGSGPSSSETFPFKLYDMLMDAERDGNDDIVSFFPPQSEEKQQGQGNHHGHNKNNGFCLHKPKEFVSQIMPKYFTTKRLASFQRQLNLYGFRRASQGPHKGAYFHEYLVKGQKMECKKIKRRRSNNIISNHQRATIPASYFLGAQNNNDHAHQHAQVHHSAGLTAPINAAAHHHIPSLTVRQLLAQGGIFPSL